MRKMTEQNMINAFGGESQAFMRYTHFASLADKEGYPNAGRLFRAIAHAETIHARSHYETLKHLNGGFVANSAATFGPGETIKNLDIALMGEEFEINEMYPVFIEVAKFQKENDAQRSFEWAFGTEKMHKKLFDKAKDAVNNNNDPKLDTIQVCSVCGYTLKGEAPDTCPLCDATKEKFEKFA